MLLSTTMRARHVVTAALDAAGAAGVKDAKLSLIPGASGGVPIVRTLTVGGPPAEIGFDYDTDPVFRYEVAISYTNGRQRSVPLTESRQSDLSIPLS